MKTSDLIDQLVTHREVQPPSSFSLPSAALIGLGTALLLTALLLGLRPVADLTSWPMLGKLAFALGLASLVLPALRRDLRPGAQLGWRRHLPWAAVVALVLAATLQVLEGYRVDLWRQDIPWCLVLVPLFALPGLVLLSHAARLQAPTDLPRTGLRIGVFAGALSAAAYALHCPNDDPLYLTIAYLPALGIMAFVGRLLGPRILAW
jgi:hypothetical protein